VTTKKTIKSAFESMLFIWGEPLDPRIAAMAFNIEKGEAADFFRELATEYETQGRGIRIREIGGKFQFVTSDENFDYLRSICTPVKERRLSQAALEVLAIVAYKQPVTKGEIDSIRGIKSDRVLDGLMKKGLVEEKGRSNAIGRPILYGTSEVFLAHFDLKTIRELPVLEDIEDTMQFDEAKSAVDIRQITMDLEMKDS
jgi:segregation and condensation protein B